MISFILFLTTRKVVVPLSNYLILLGCLRQSFRHIKISNISIISYLIDRERIEQKFQSRYFYLIPQTKYIIDNIWNEKIRKRKLNRVSNECEAGEEEPEYHSTNLINYYTFWGNYKLKQRQNSVRQAKGLGLMNKYQKESCRQ